ncbi:spindle and kinetochore-associated protein 3 isoform X3 [Ailuropoda melanoleuca]|uniref:spindle and kinetochore-associated protein 3 isoform X3 n=1 Tax=Ailuropoda melanoleuca TaxID=9646 RepID=UPI0014944DE5|nr:spindle and kinetochore-associated protein 3 isoform X3 [Ailuropoda melanoleuca]
MDLIRSFHAKLRSLAITLDSETARLQRALNGEESVDEQEIIDSESESTKHEDFHIPDVKDNLSDPAVPSTSGSEKSPRSPQLSDFGLERYMVSQVPPKAPQAVNDHEEEPKNLTPSSKQSVVKVLKTPKCALKMDDFECVTPKLEHFGISDYSACLNEGYTMGLKNIKENKSEEAIEPEPVTSDNFFAAPGLQQLKKNDDAVFSGSSGNHGLSRRAVSCSPQPRPHGLPVHTDANCTDSPLAPTFCTPGLKIPSTKNSTALGSTNYPLSKTNSSSKDLEMKDCTSLVLNSDKCFESFADPSSPVISSYENLLRTPTPPEVTTIPEDILQILSKYNSNLATPVAVKAVPPSKGFLTKYEGLNIRGVGNKENW